jgi:uncharacterized lipoprotein
MVGLLPAVRRIHTAGITALAATLLAGCSISTTEIDSGQAEEFVKQASAKPPRSVECPEGIEAKEGGTFTCETVDSAGKRYRVTLHMADDNGRVTVGPSDFKPVGGG